MFRSVTLRLSRSRSLSSQAKVLAEIAVEKNNALKTAPGTRSGNLTPTAMKSPRGGRARSEADADDNTTRHGLTEALVAAGTGELAGLTRRARWVTLIARWVMLRARGVTLRARWVTLRARWVTLRARWVTLRARWVTLRARWVTLTARWVTLRARWVRRGRQRRSGVGPFVSGSEPRGSGSGSGSGSGRRQWRRQQCSHGGVARGVRGAAPHAARARGAVGARDGRAARDGDAGAGKGWSSPGGGATWR
jgi:hypothetical protein